MTDWEPATEAEAAMRDALRANDQELYFRILARTDLLLPVSAEALAGQAPMGWGTWTTNGRTHVLAFTSDAALRACLGASGGSSRRCAYHDLASGWPNHEWWLAVNPGLPIEGYLPAWFVSQLSRGDVRLPGRTLGARARLEQVEQLARNRAAGADPPVPEPSRASPPTPPYGANRPPVATPPRRGLPDQSDAPAEALRAAQPDPRGTADPPSPDGAAPPVSNWLNNPRRQLRPEPAHPDPGASPANGQPAGRNSFFDPVPPGRATGPAPVSPLRAPDRVVPPSRLGESGQAFPRRRPYRPEQVGDEPTRAFQFTDPTPADPPAPPPAAPAGRFGAANPVADQTQALPRRQPRPDPAVAEPTQALPRRVPNQPAAEPTQPLPRRVPGVNEPAVGEQTQPIPQPGPPVATEPPPVADPPAPAAPAPPGYTGLSGYVDPPVEAAAPAHPYPTTDPAGYGHVEPTADPPGNGHVEAGYVGVGPTVEPAGYGDVEAGYAGVGPTVEPAGYGDVEAGYAGVGPTVEPAGYGDVEAGYAGVGPTVEPAGYGDVEPTGHAGSEPVGAASPLVIEGTVVEARDLAEPAYRPDPGEGSAYPPDTPDPSGEPGYEPVAAGHGSTGVGHDSAGSGHDPAGVAYGTVVTGAPESAYESVAAAYQPAEPDPDTAGWAQAAEPSGAGAPPAVDFRPANDVEEELLAAAGTGSTDTFLSTLLLARVLLPVAPESTVGSRPGESGFVWRTEQLDGGPYVVVYTSPERLAELVDTPVETVQVKFVQLIRRWPDEQWSFAVNPGTPVGAKLPGEQIVALANWAAEVGLGDDVEPEPVEPVAATTAGEPASPARYATTQEDPNRPPMMQKAVAPSQLAYYLDRGYDRVSGFVHRAGEVAHLNSPAKLHAALGLGYPGSPFSADADEIYVLRWPAYRPSLYRIPYGGQNENAMRAMEGWVIERPPFRGNGFAPGESSDVVAEFKVDSARLPHGTQLWRIGADGSERVVATLDTDALLWRQVGDQ